MEPGIISAVAGAGSSLVTSFANMLFANQQNQITREREDTAIQRRAKDMEAAGFNPVLAAGNPAGAQALSLPRIEDPGAAAMEMMKGRQNVAVSAAEEVRIGEQTKQIKQASRIMKAEADMKEYERDVQRAAGDPLGSVANLVVSPEGSYDFSDAVKAAKARLSQAGFEAKGADLLNLLRQAQTKEAGAGAGLKELDLKTLENLGGGAAANAGLQVLLSLLRLLK